MDQKNEQIVPLRIKNLAELKRCIRPGTELVATSHSKHPTLVGLVRVVTEVQTNAYYSVVKDQPTHQYSTCNYGKGFRSDFEKASNYLFEGTTIKVLDRRSGDGSVLYEMELYPGECLVLGQKNDMEENADIREDNMAGLMIQNLSRELFAVADENGGKLKNRVVLFCDELGTMPPFDILPLFSAGRSRRLTLVPIIQSLAQLEKNYGKEGSEIIQDNCQDTIFGGFAPGSQTAEVLSRNLGTRTVQSGSVSQSKNDPSQSLQMVERPLMTPDELKSIPKGHFVVMKTGCHPMQTRLRLFLEWGITFEKEGYTVPVHENMQVHYAGRKELEESILCHALKNTASEKADTAPQQNGGQKASEEDVHAPASDDTSLRT